MFKRFSVLAAALILVLLGAAACTPHEETKPVQYTVLVGCDSSLSDAQKDAVYGAVSVVVYDKDGAEVARKGLTKDSYGSSYAEFELLPAEYDIKLAGLPDGYHVDADSVRVTASKRDATFLIDDEEIIAEKMAYTVTVKKPDGTPAAGITVQLCTAGNATCHDMRTNADGVAQFSLLPDTYEVHLNDLPAGFTFSETLTVTKDSATLTITLTAE